MQQGSAFIGYGIIMSILLVAGEAWIRRKGRSPEWWDSWVIMLWVGFPTNNWSNILTDLLLGYR